MWGSSRRPLAAVMAWVWCQPPKVKAFLAVVAGMAALVFIRFIDHDHNNLFVATEATHAIGIGVLIYKLTKEKTCAGSSVRPSPLLLLLLTATASHPLDPSASLILDPDCGEPGVCLSIHGLILEVRGARPPFLSSSPLQSAHPRGIRPVGPHLGGPPSDVCVCVCALINVAILVD
jgi:hypothetical protein